MRAGRLPQAVAYSSICAHTLGLRALATLRWSRTALPALLWHGNGQSVIPGRHDGPANMVVAMAHAFCACALQSSQDGTRGTTAQRANRRLTDSQASRRVAFDVGAVSADLNKPLIRDGAPGEIRIARNYPRLLVLSISRIICDSMTA